MKKLLKTKEDKVLFWTAIALIVVVFSVDWLVMKEKNKTAAAGAITDDKNIQTASQLNEQEAKNKGYIK